MYFHIVLNQNNSWMPHYIASFNMVWQDISKLYPLLLISTNPCKTHNTISCNIAIRKHSPGNSIAFCSFVHLYRLNISVSFDLCLIRNDFSLHPGTLLSKKNWTAWVAIPWHKKRRTQLFSSLDSRSASSVNKRQFYHTNFVFVNAKFINISEIKELFIC
jgi:hypothetical protein